MPRADGRKLVAAAVTATVAVIGFAQIYLPFMADRDRLRGLNEEEHMSPQAKREIDMLMRKMHDEQEAAKKDASGTNAGSMWSNMKRTNSKQEQGSVGS
jgi:hypothetical protein